MQTVTITLYIFTSPVVGIVFGVFAVVVIAKIVGWIIQVLPG